MIYISYNVLAVSCGNCFIFFKNCNKSVAKRKNNFGFATKVWQNEKINFVLPQNCGKIFENEKNQH